MSRVWRIPAALAVLSTIGLTAAILGDGLWHWLCWITLTAPLAVCAVKLWRRSPSTP